MISQAYEVALLQFALSNDTDPATRNAHGPFNGYYLLNEVGSGGTLSSLFTILSLFTEDIKLSWNQASIPTSEDGDVHVAGDEEDGIPVMLGRKGRTNSDVSNFDMAHSGGERRSTADGASMDAPSETVTAGTHRQTWSDRLGSPETRAFDAIRPISLPATSFPSPLLPGSLETPYGPVSSRARSRSNHQGDGDTRKRPEPKQTTEGVIGRATVDTTLAVIPAEAFKRLTRLFPKASGHIVSGESGCSHRPDAHLTERPPPKSSLRDSVASHS